MVAPVGAVLVALSAILVVIRAAAGRRPRPDATRPNTASTTCTRTATSTKFYTPARQPAQNLSTHLLPQQQQTPAGHHRVAMTTDQVPSNQKPRCRIVGPLAYTQADEILGFGSSADDHFEVCEVDRKGHITSCDVVEKAHLTEALQELGVQHVETDTFIAEHQLESGDPIYVQAVGGSRQGEHGQGPLADEAGEADNGGDTGPAVYTKADLSMYFTDDSVRVPTDMVLHYLGPDAMDILAANEEEQESPKATPVSDAPHAEHEDIRYHLHFGAGRLGLGLVVPALSKSGIPFAVVQRPKKHWLKVKEEMDGNALDLTINGHVMVSNIKILSTASDELPEAMPPRALVFGQSVDDIRQLVDRATTFSCSLGGAMIKVLKPLLAELPPRPYEEQPLLFACENDHTLVIKMQKEFKGRVRVIDCMVDRVCMGRTIGVDGIDVEAEPWDGTIAVLDPGLQTEPERVPFGSTIVKIPVSELESRYISEKKFTLVNGMQTVLAFISLVRDYDRRMDDLYYTYNESALVQQKDEERQSDAPEKKEIILQKYSQMGVEARHCTQAWRAARIGKLIDEFGADNMLEWQGCETKDELWETMLLESDEILYERFSRVDDLVSRILGGGVVNRFQTRLEPVPEWLRKRQDAQAQETEASQHRDDVQAFLEYALQRDGWALNEDVQCGEHPTLADCGEALVQEQCSKLVQDAARFCTEEQQILHKEMISRQRSFGGKYYTPEFRKAKIKEAIQQRYKLIASEADGQTEQYREYVESMDENAKVSLVSMAASLGFQLDISTGALYYADDFEDKRVHLNFDLLFCRQGRTMGNLEPRMLQGNVDGPLNRLDPIGHRQATSAAGFIERQIGRGHLREPDLVLVSPNTRAVQTAQHFLDGRSELTPHRLLSELKSAEQAARESSTGERAANVGVDWKVWQGADVDQMDAAELRGMLSHVAPEHYTETQLTCMSEIEARAELAKLEHRIHEDTLRLMTPERLSQLRDALTDAKPGRFSDDELLRMSGRTEVWEDTHEMGYGAWDNLYVSDVDPDHMMHLMKRDQNCVVKADSPYEVPDTDRQVPAESFVEVLFRVHGVLTKLNKRMKGCTVQDGELPLVLMFNHSIVGSAIRILCGRGKHVADSDGRLAYTACLFKFGLPELIHEDDEENQDDNMFDSVLPTEEPMVAVGPMRELRDVSSLPLRGEL